MGRAKRRKGNEAQRVKPPTPSQAIDAHIGDEEQNGKQKRNKKLEEDLRAMVGHFIQVYRRRGLKVNSSKRKVMVLDGEEGLECEVWVDGMRLEHASEFKYLWCVLCESGPSLYQLTMEVISRPNARRRLATWYP